MAKTQNDKTILVHKAKIEEKKKLIGQSQRFNPITNCLLELNGTKHNINVFDKNQCLLFIAQLQSLKNGLEQVLPGEKLIISGFDVKDWITDLSSKYNVLNIKAEQERLKQLEDQLHRLLTSETKVELELSDLIGQI